jgi:hypothetical protein
MAYATVLELRAQIDKISNATDAVLANILTAASISIDRAVNHYLPGFEFYAAPAAASVRLYAGSGKRWQRIDPCIAVSTVAVKDSYTDLVYTAWGAADWIAFSSSFERPTFSDLPFTALMADPNGDFSYFTRGIQGPTVQVSARWGYSATPPADIAEACIMQSARWYKRLQGAMSDALASGELGMLLYQKSLDPDIRRILVDGRYINSVMYGL